MTQDFGGEWTERKLQTLETYAEMFAVALGRRFKLHYIDAFAGDGVGAQKRRNEPDGQSSFFPASNIDIIEGSASRLTDLPFGVFHFIDRNKNNVEGLKSLIERKEVPNAEVHHGDANELTVQILDSLGGSDRVLLFFDPFGLQVKWETLERIARHQTKCDVWYLFPFFSINRSIPNHAQNINPGMKASLEQCLGMKEKDILKQVFTSESEPDLFGDEEGKTRKEAGVETLFVSRLTEIFEYVFPKPLRLRNGKGHHLFSLVLCSNNPSSNAHRLIERFAKHASANHDQ
ncbi:MAG: three-Cys-motif partner protein TcmP [Parvibaculales bacterium]